MHNSDKHINKGPAQLLENAAILYSRMASEDVYDIPSVPRYVELGIVSNEPDESIGDGFFDIMDRQNMSPSKAKHAIEECKSKYGKSVDYDGNSEGDKENVTAVEKCQIVTAISTAVTREDKYANKEQGSSLDVSSHQKPKTIGKRRSYIDELGTLAMFRPPKPVRVSQVTRQLDDMTIDGKVRKDEKLKGISSVRRRSVDVDSLVRGKPSAQRGSLMNKPGMAHGSRVRSASHDPRPLSQTNALFQRRNDDVKDFKGPITRARSKQIEERLKDSVISQKPSVGMLAARYKGRPSGMSATKNQSKAAVEQPKSSSVDVNRSRPPLRRSALFGAPDMKSLGIGRCLRSKPANHRTGISALESEDEFRQAVTHRVSSQGPTAADQRNLSVTVISGTAISNTNNRHLPVDTSKRVSVPYNVRKEQDMSTTNIRRTMVERESSASLKTYKADELSRSKKNPRTPLNKVSLPHFPTPTKNKLKNSPQTTDEKSSKAHHRMTKSEVAAFVSRLSQPKYRRVLDHKDKVSGGAAVLKSVRSPCVCPGSAKKGLSNLRLGIEGITLSRSRSNSRGRIGTVEPARHVEITH
ncbi:hypothetical protein AB6A40_001573 [Gnathostoma spinigerum]|uniref:Uncharacterized protein n=1 Tax=Gnathostoma spinigerum TaxID=75299 RepID=A0ABD6E4H4_9BILA